jgi:hypothetical protein
MLGISSLLFGTCFFQPARPADPEKNLAIPPLLRQRAKFGF